MKQNVECAFPKPKHKRKANHSRRNATRSRARMIRDLDAIARQEVFERDLNTCVRCGSRDALQWSHVHSRRHYCLRWDDDNTKVLCVRCHAWWTYNPGLAYDWFSKQWPDRWERITRVLIINPKVNVRELWEARCGNA